MLGLKTSASPIATRITWVQRSAIARIRLSRVDSWVPFTFSAARKTITATPPMMSPGEFPSHGQNTAR